MLPEFFFTIYLEVIIIFTTFAPINKIQCFIKNKNYEKVYLTFLPYIGYIHNSKGTERDRYKPDNP